MQGPPKDMKDAKTAKDVVEILMEQAKKYDSFQSLLL